jgi:hypothetical protein
MIWKEAVMASFKALSQHLPQSSGSQPWASCLLMGNLAYFRGNELISYTLLIDRVKLAVVFSLFGISTLLFKKGGRVLLVYWLSLRSNSAKEVKCCPTVTEKKHEVTSVLIASNPVDI